MRDKFIVMRDEYNQSQPLVVAGVGALAKNEIMEVMSRLPEDYPFNHPCPDDGVPALYVCEVDIISDNEGGTPVYENEKWRRATSKDLIEAQLIKE